MIAPPYDVLSDADVADLGARSSHNIVHIDVPAGGEQRYENAKRFLDAWLADPARSDVEIDYVHGEDVTVALGRRPGNVGFLLPGIGKDAFFRSIAVDGPLPRKTFSLGHANDKRFYMECRRIEKK